MAMSTEEAAPSRSRSRARFEAIHRELRERICLLHYPPGHVLGEIVLAGEFGVSRTPMRRVLGRLESERLVERRHGIGTIVTDVDPDELADIYAFRMRLAELMGELDPLPRSAEDVERIRRLRDRALALGAQRDEGAFARLNLDYVEALLAGVGNPALRETMERLFFQTSRIWLHTMAGMDWREEIDIFARELADIATAMALGDLRAVGMIHSNHISMSLLRLSRHLDRLRAQGG